MASFFMVARWVLTPVWSMVMTVNRLMGGQMGTLSDTISA